MLVLRSASTRGVLAPSVVHSKIVAALSDEAGREGGEGEREGRDSRHHSQPFDRTEYIAAINAELDKAA